MRQIQRMFHTWLAFWANASENGAADWPLEAANLDVNFDERFTLGWHFGTNAPQKGEVMSQIRRMFHTWRAFLTNAPHNGEVMYQIR